MAELGCQRVPKCAQRGVPARSGRRDRRALPWTLVVLSHSPRRDAVWTGEGAPVPRAWCLVVAPFPGGTVRLKMAVKPGGHVVVALSGEFDIATAPAARDLLAELASAGVTGITVDLGGLTFVDAAGLRVLADASRAGRCLPGGFRLVAVPARVVRLLRLTGLDRHLAVFPVPPGSRHRRIRAAPLAAVTGTSGGAA